VQTADIPDEHFCDRGKCLTVLSVSLQDDIYNTDDNYLVLTTRIDYNKLKLQ